MQASDPTERAQAKRKIAIFLALAVVLVGVSYIPILRTGSLEAGNGMAIIVVMWMPGLAAILTQLITSRSLKGLGWKPRTLPLLGLALILPVLYCLPVYGLTWASGLGTFAPAGWQAETGGAPVGTALALLLTFGLLQSLLSATGEEIGWRGLLVPQLARLTTFRNTWLLSSLVWLLYHVPLIIAADYHGAGTPLWYSLLCFTGLVFTMSAVMAWIRLASDSLWPCALLHASHNLIVQAIFDAGTTPGPYTGYVTGEFGAGLVITIGITAWVLTRGRRQAV